MSRHCPTSVEPKAFDSLCEAMIPLMACSVNFSNNAEIRRPHFAFRLTVDRQTRAATNVVKGVAATERRDFVCLLTLLELDLRVRIIHRLPQTGCFQTHAGGALVQLRLRRDDRVDESIAPTMLCCLLTCMTASHSAKAIAGTSTLSALVRPKSDCVHCDKTNTETAVIAMQQGILNVQFA